MTTASWFALRNRVQDFRLNRVAPGAVLSLRSALARHPLLCRAHTSDRDVFRQVFTNEEYAAVGTGQRPGLIIDCGANVGYASAYFLTRFDGCRVIALEPDAENFRCLSRNLAPYGASAECVHGALWSHCTSLKMAETTYRDGKHWTKQVAEGGSIPGFDVAALLRRSGAERVSILKIDIEGAEAVVFQQPNLDWLERVDTLMIELHDDSSFGAATPIFEKAIADRGFNCWRDRDTTVCSRWGR